MQAHTTSITQYLLIDHVFKIMVDILGKKKEKEVPVSEKRCTCPSWRDLDCPEHGG